MVAFEKDHAVTKNPVGQRRRSFVKLNKVDRASCGAFEVGQERAEVARTQHRARKKVDGDIEIAVAMRRASRHRSEGDRVGYAGVPLEHSADTGHWLTIAMFSGATAIITRRGYSAADTMKIEHTACQVEDPAAFARWYVAHLGLRVKRAQTVPPFGHFLADDGDSVMLEVYRFPQLPLPDYRAMEPRLLHLAFRADDVAATRARLIAAGATPEGDIVRTENGDEVCMLRDPWGLAVQLVKRGAPMIP